MRIFSYRNKRALRRALLIALLAVVLIGLLILARISYLGRYAVYSPDGVYFDKTQKLQREDVPAAAPAADPEEYPFETILSAFEEDAHPDSDLPISDEPLSIDRLEWEHIQRVLNENDGNISATARALKMHRRTLQRKLSKRPVKS